MELNKKTLRNIFLGVAGCIFLYWLLHETERLTAVLSAAGAVISPFVVGAALAFVLNVPMRAIERILKFIKPQAPRRAIAILLTFLVVLLVFTGVIYLLVPQLVITVESLIETMPGFFQRVQDKVMIFLSENPEVMEWLQANTDFENLNWQELIEKAVSLVSNGVSTVFDTAISALVGLGTGIFNAVLSLVFCLYCSRSRRGREYLFLTLS